MLKSALLLAFPLFRNKIKIIFLKLICFSVNLLVSWNTVPVPALVQNFAKQLHLSQLPVSLWLKVKSILRQIC